MKFVHMSETISLSSLYSEKIILHGFNIVCTEPFHLLYDMEVSVVIYNTKVMLTINWKDISFSRIPGPP